MQNAAPIRVQLGAFEFDLRAGELRKGNRRIRLQGQPFQILRMLVEHSGDLVTLEEIKKQLWPNDTVVEFDHSIHTAMKKLRQALGDLAENPTYIETLARRGYRLMVPVEWGAAENSPAPTLSPEAGEKQPALSSPKAGAPAAAAPAPPDPGALTGRTVSHYRVLEIIGGGGMGVVYRAEDLKLGRAVALKFLPEELGSDPQALERFSREARAVSSLDHPNICPIFEFGEHEGRPFMVMQLLEGQTLRDRLAPAEGPLPLAELLDIGIQVSDGLQAAHEKAIIHRDIKPANVFITDKGVCKILDFGLAKLLVGYPAASTTIELSSRAERVGAATSEVEGPAVPWPLENADLSTPGCPDPQKKRVGEEGRHSAQDDSARVGEANLTRTGAAMGTAGYMSPEQVRGEKLDPRTDLFSFGLVLYEMATGQRAFSGETATLVREAILHQPPVPVHDLNSELPPELGTIVNKALEKDRERRYQSAAEMRTDLQSVMPDGRVAAPWSAKKSMAAAVLTLLILAGVSEIIYRRLAISRTPHVDVQHMKMTRITDNGKVGLVAISPDGRYVAYTARGQGLWVQQVVPESKVQVVSPSADPFRAVTFSPDGNYLYFVRGDKGYVVPALGGTPRLIIEDTYGGLAVSPDGRKLAFVHGGDAPRSQLIVVNQDGTGEHVIAEHPRESGMRFTAAAAPSWSPDGKLIAMPAQRRTDSVLNVYPVEGGHPKVIPLPSDAGQGGQALWLPDQSGLVLRIHSSWSAPPQIWLQPFPNGNLQRLTNDLEGYHSLSLSADGKLLAAVLAEYSSTIFVGPASRPDKGTAISAGKSDGVGLVWMPDGTLLSQNVDSEFSSLTPDGKRRVSLFKDEVFPGGFSVCRNGRFIILQRSSLGEQQTIWRADATGHNLKQLTEGLTDMAPDCSPNAQSVIYASLTKTRLRLMRVPIDGGAPAALNDTDTDVVGLRYSPDGREIADIESSDVPQATEKLVLVVRNSQTGHATKSFDLPAGFSLPFNSVGWILRWTPDGRMLTYALWKSFGGAVNLWGQSLSGGPPRQITNFPEGIRAYDWSPDGKQLALTRGASSSDVVLISNFH